MELVFRISLFIAGIINIIPSILAFVPNKIAMSYGIQIPNQNYELLLRHRAVLFGIIGGLMIYSAITKKNYTLAVIIGLVSMLSFIILVAVVDGDINLELKKVMRIDIIGIVILLLGYIMFKLKS